MRFSIDYIKQKIGELREDEFLGKDNLPYCKKCKGARWFYLEEQKFLHRTMCDCQIKADEEETNKQKIEKTKEKISKYKSLCLLGERYKDCKFVNSIINEQNKDAFNRCQNYVKNASECLRKGYGLYIYGNNDSGKTHLTACMCNELIELEYCCLYTNFSEIIKGIKATYSNNEISETHFINRVVSVPFLFIDDFGKETLSREFNSESGKWLEEKIFDVLNKRYNSKKPIIFSSNYSIAELGKRFDFNNAIITRINEMSTRVIKLNCSSFREINLKQQSKDLKKLGV